MQNGRTLVPRGPDFKTRDRIGQGSITLMVGLSRSGKSTYVNNKSRGEIIISSDDIRRALGIEWDVNLEPVVQSIMYYSAAAHLIRGGCITIDATNLTKAVRKQWIDLARRMNNEGGNVPVDVVKVAHPIDTVAYRKVVEEDNFPWSVITKQMFEYEEFRHDECDGLQYTYITVPNVVDKQKETANLSTD